MWRFSRGIRDTTIEEDLEKDMKKESENHHNINSLVYNCHPWGGCVPCLVPTPRGKDIARYASNPGGVIASVNSFRREDVQKYFDEVTHVELPARLVKEARAEELEYFNTLPVWKVVKTQERWDITGSPPISTK